MTHTHRSSLIFSRMLQGYLASEGVLAASAGWQKGNHASWRPAASVEGLVIPPKDGRAPAAEGAGLAVKVATTADAAAGAHSCGCPESHASCPTSISSVPCHLSWGEHGSPFSHVYRPLTLSPWGQGKV